MGFEALVRLEHPRKGLILPAEFLPVAEETGMIVPMGRHTLREACRRSKDWQDDGRRPLTVSVNLSVRQLRTPTSWPTSPSRWRRAGSPRGT